MPALQFMARQPTRNECLASDEYLPHSGIVAAEADTTAKRTDCRESARRKLQNVRFAKSRGRKAAKTEI